MTAIMPVSDMEKNAEDISRMTRASSSRDKGMSSKMEQECRQSGCPSIRAEAQTGQEAGARA